MPFQVSLADGGLGVIYQGEGLIRRKDILDQKRRLGLRAAAEKIRYVLVDHTSSVESTINGDDIRALISELEADAVSSAHIVFAMVAPSAHLFGVSRMWQTLVEKWNWKTSVFRQREEAEKWIAQLVPEAKFCFDERLAD